MGMRMSTTIEQNLITFHHARHSAKLDLYCSKFCFRAAFVPKFRLISQLRRLSHSQSITPRNSELTTR